MTCLPSEDLTVNTHEADRLYEQYVKPLEQMHRGQYAGVSPDGEIVLASTLIDAVRKSVQSFGKDNSIVFHIGDRVVGHIR